MSRSTVFFTDLRTRMGYSLLDKTRKLFEVSGFADRIEKGDKVAIKLHFGETGNTSFLSPQFARAVVDEVKKSWRQAVSSRHQHPLHGIPRKRGGSP